MLWQHVLGVSRAWLVAHDTDLIPVHKIQEYKSLEQRRLDGEPMAYILGQREFMSHMFHVAPGVLIPRPETELLVEIALAELEAQLNTHILTTSTPKRVLDLGTGSGAIAISIALANPDVQVYATDISPEALEIAHKNAINLGAKVEFLCGSWYHALPDNMDFDVIVSNPPYIAAADTHLQQGDLRFEPRSALTDEANGLNAFLAIAAGVSNRLRQGGSMFLEHGWDQSCAVAAILHQAGFKNIVSHKDFAGINRVTGGHF